MKTNKQFLDDLERRYGDEFKPLEEYRGSKVKIPFEHTVCGNKFSARPNSIFNGYGCPRCGGVHRPTTEEFKEEVSKVHGNEYEVLGEYKSNGVKIQIKHKECNKVFETAPANILGGSGCPACSFKRRGMSRRKLEEVFLKEVKNASGGEYEVLGKYEGRDRSIKFRHLLCGEVSETRADNLRQGSGCIKCNPTRRRTQEEFKEVVKTMAEGEYEVVGEYLGTAKKVELKHLVCGKNFSVIANSFIQGARCLHCNLIRSKGEWEIKRVLEALGVEHDEEKRMGGRLRADFFIHKYHAYIEFDGKQHFESIDVWGGEEELKERQFRDEVKNAFCRLQGIPLLRIPYWEFDNIPQIVTEFIEELEEERKKRKEDDLLDGE